MEAPKSQIANELADVGYHTAEQKRGLVKWINSVLAVLLFVSVMINIGLVRTNSQDRREHTKELIELHRKSDENTDKYLNIFINMLEKQDKIERKVDTAQVLLEAAKSKND